GDRCHFVDGDLVVHTGNAPDVKDRARGGFALEVPGDHTGEGDLAFVDLDRDRVGRHVDGPFEHAGRRSGELAIVGARGAGAAYDSVVDDVMDAPDASGRLHGCEPLRNAGDVALEGHHAVHCGHGEMALDTGDEQKFVGDGGLKNLIAS